jgi:hypothetical protein
MHSRCVNVGQLTVVRVVYWDSVPLGGSALPANFNVVVACQPRSTFIWTACQPVPAPACCSCQTAAKHDIVSGAAAPLQCIFRLCQTCMHCFVTALLRLPLDHFAGNPRLCNGWLPTVSLPRLCTRTHHRVLKVVNRALLSASLCRAWSHGNSCQQTTSQPCWQP